MFLWLISFSGLQSLFIFVVLFNLVLTWVFKSKKGSQGIGYHYHLDTRPGSLFGIKIPNYWDVVSNLIFAVLGAIGFVECIKHLPSRSMAQDEKIGWYCFFLGFFFVSVGSAYYHWRPNNWTLVWDRLPMTIAFMANYYNAQRVFLPPDETSLIGNLGLGVLSILLWHCSLYLNKGYIRNVHCNYLGNQDGTHMTRPQATKELQKMPPVLVDQLLPYFLIQFFPLCCSAVMFIFWPSGAELHLSYIFPTVFLYILAKFLEVLDLKSDHFFKQTMKGVVSGHTLKHFVAGLATLSFIIFIRNGEQMSEGPLN